MVCGRDGGKTALFHKASLDWVCLSSQATFLQHSPTPTAQIHTSSANARFKGTFQNFGGGLCLCYSVPPTKTAFTSNTPLNVWKKYRLEGCQITSLFPHYSYSSNTQSYTPRDLTFCQTTVVMKTLNPTKR